MVDITPGTFRMGCLSGFRCRDNEPVREMAIAQPFDLSVYEVTVAEFRRFVEATGYVTDAEYATRRWPVGKPLDRMAALTIPRAKRDCMGFSAEHLRTVRSGTQVWRMSAVFWTWKQPGFEVSDQHPVVVYFVVGREGICQLACRGNGGSPTACRARRNGSSRRGPAPWRTMTMTIPLRGATQRETGSTCAGRECKARSARRCPNRRSWAALGRMLSASTTSEPTLPNGRRTAGAGSFAACRATARPGSKAIARSEPCAAAVTFSLPRPMKHGPVKQCADRSTGPASA